MVLVGFNDQGGLVRVGEDGLVELFGGLALGGGALVFETIHLL